jgi:hypothetical protein
MKKDAEYLTPLLTQNFVDRLKRQKGFDTMNETEYTNYVNISQSDLGANLFVLIVLVASIVWLILDTGGGS